MRKLGLTFYLIFHYSCIQAQWINLNTSIPGDIYAVHFITDSIGFVVGEIGIHGTTDGGITWNKHTIQNNPPDSLLLESSKLNDVFCLNSHCYVVGKDTINGNGVIFRALSPGYSWSLTDTVTGKGLNGIGRLNNGQVAVGEQGVIKVSTNNGATWSYSNSKVTSDLRAVSGSHINNSCSIGGDHVLLTKSSSTSTPWTRRASHDLVDVYRRTISHYLYGVNKDHVVYGQWSRYYKNFNFDGPLNATSMSFYSNSEGFIGTENGIYRSIDILKYWEIQPSALNYHINDLHFPHGSPTGYAVGNNGLILKTINKGGAGLPYIAIDGPDGGCKDSALFFKNMGSSSYSYTWKLDQVTVSNAYDLSYTFQTPGVHILTLVADNGDLIDSVQRTLHVVRKPDGNKLISIGDSILCHSGVTDITIHQSELNIEYRLNRISDGKLMGTTIGTGGDVVLISDTLVDSTLFQISAKHPLADCEIFLRDTFLIAVEKTLADFKPTLLNANLSESVLLINKSQQADTFHWQFGNGASMPNSVQKHPYINYSITGPTFISLISISQFGCRDTLIRNGPFIYDDVQVKDHCWALNFDGVDSEIYKHDRAESIKVTNSGDLIICGSYSDCEYGTKTGSSSGVQNGLGFFIARYSNYGVLKWLVKSIDPNPSPYNNALVGNFSYKGSAFDLALDENDNIYIAGWQDPGYTFFSNDDKIIPLDSGNSEGFIMKLDSNGIYQWHTRMDQGFGQRIAIDKSANIYVGGAFNYTLKVYSKSGQVFQASTGSRGAGFITKLDSSGVVKWLTDLPDEAFTDFQVDKKGNLYGTGQHSSLVTFNGVSSSSIYLPYAGASNIFLVKYNTHGNPLWAHSITSKASGSFDFGNTIEVSPKGDIYIGGRVASDAIGEFVQFPSLSGQVDSLHAGGYVLFSYDSTGNFRWGTGSQYSEIGSGSVLSSDEYGYIYVGGYLQHQPSGSTTLISTDSAQIVLPAVNGSFFIAKYDSLGRIIWATLENGLTSTSTASNLSLRDLTIDRSQYTYVAGILGLQAGLGGYGIASDTLSPNGHDGFIAKFSPSACLQSDSIIPLLSAGTYCRGAQVDIPFFLDPFLILGGGNIFKVELSDSTGSFLAPIVIGSLSSSQQIDTIRVTIPQINPTGRYLIRIVTSSPIIIGNEVPIFISPENPPIPQHSFSSLCKGDSILLQASPGILHNWQSISGISFGSSQSIMVSPDSSTLFYADVMNACGSITDTFEIQILPTYVNQLPDISICQGDSALIFGNFESSPGTYHNQMLTAQGCDSSEMVNLIVTPTYVNQLPDISICQGDSALIFGNFESSPGTYHNQMLTTQGCDSSEMVNLIVTPTYANQLPDISICQGDSALIFGNFESSPGTYHNQMLTTQGCDSSEMVNLIVTPTHANQLPDISICQGDSALIFGNFESSPGTYHNQMLTTQGCDSSEMVNLIVTPTYANQLPDISICQGDSALIFGNFESSPGYLS